MTTDELNLGNQSASGTASPREAIAFVPQLHDFCGDDDAQAYFLHRLEHPFEGDGNVLVTGVPGSGKTHMIESYLRQRFHNPLFHNGDVEEGCKFDDLYRQIGRKIERAAYDIRFFQDNVPGKIYAYIRIDAASDSPKTVERKVADALYHESSDHAFVFVDEIGELYKKGLEDCLRPVMTAGNITVYATAQNVRGKLRSDTSQEDADRRRAFFRRFPRILETSNPTEAELLRFLAKRIHDWNLGIDSPDTLRLLVMKSGGVVGYAIRSLIKAIDEPDRRLTMGQVLRDDADPAIF